MYSENHRYNFDLPKKSSKNIVPQTTKRITNPVEY